MESDRTGVARETVAAIIVAVLIVATISWGVSRPDEDDADDAAPLVLAAAARMDPDIRTGTLANGLRYYLRQNDYPEQRAELRLVVHAGSVLEDDDQRGLAHAVEHMAFRGTRRFPGRAIDEYLQSIGMRLGEDVNATTGYDETVYRLTIPTDERGALDTGMTILAEWAHAVTFDSVEAAREAPIVFEEWRGRRDADERLDEARDSLLLRGTRYAMRPVIGDTASLRRFDVAAMRRFYRDWYRPDLMAVIAVGDFDVGAVERRLRRHFEPIPAPASARAKPALGSTQQRDARVIMLRDPEVVATRVAFYYERSPHVYRTLGDYRRALVERIGRSILRDRLENEADRSGSSLLSAGITLRRRAREVEAHVIGATAVDERLPEALATLGSVVTRLARFGPRSSELDAVKEAILRERRDDLSGPPESADVADALIEHHLAGDVVATAVDEYKWTSELLGGIGASDIMEFLTSLSMDRRPTILVMTPSARRVLPVLPNEQRLLAALDSAVAGAADGTSDDVDPSALAVSPQPGTVRSRRTLTAIDTQEWVLSNGMRVLLKPTRFADDEVLFRLTAPGGASLASPDDYPSAYMADNVIEAMGVRDMPGFAVSRILDDRALSLSPTVTDERVDIQGEGRQRDVELMLQLAHLYLTAPREDAQTFARYRERLRTFARNRAADPRAVFEDSAASLLRPGETRALHATGRFVDAIDLGTAVRFWRARASNASNMTAVLVGDYEIWKVSPLIERYLGSLPSGEPERPAPVGFSPIGAQVVKSIESGVEPQAQVRIVLDGAMEMTLEADAALNATRDLLALVLETRLREELGGTYGTSVYLTMRQAPSPRFTFTIDFDADPERADSLATAALVDIERLRTRGPTAAEASKVREAAIRHNEDRARGNDYWVTELTWHSVSGWSLDAIADHPEDAERITEASLRDASARYLDGRRFVRLTRLPIREPPHR